MAETVEEKLVEVVVIVDNHKHQGEPVAKGDKIKVTSDQKDWMLKNKLIKG